MVGIEIVQNGVHALDLRRELVLHVLQEIDPMGNGAARIVLGEGLSRSWLKRPEDIALATSAVVDLLPGPLRGARGRAEPAPASKRLGRFGPHLVQTEP